MDELSKNEALGDLYALYGSLLTSGQQEYFEDYYYDDLSLGEIADNHQVSRAAVYDNLKRSTKALEKYEAKLQLLTTFGQIEAGLENAEACLDDDDVAGTKQQLQALLRLVRGD